MIVTTNSKFKIKSLFCSFFQNMECFFLIENFWTINYFENYISLIPKVLKCSNFKKNMIFPQEKTLLDPYLHASSGHTAQSSDLGFPLITFFGILTFLLHIMELDFTVSWFTY